MMKASSLTFVLIIYGGWLYGFTHGNLLEQIIQNGTSINVLEEMIERQKLISYLDEMKNSIENSNLNLLRNEMDYKDSGIFDERIDSFPDKCQAHGIPSNCAEATACTKRSGYYYIKIEKFSNASFLVECDAHTDGGGWTIIQRRQDGSIDFYRPWDDYKVGFGMIEGEFFIGLEKLYALTNFLGSQELLILMEHYNETNGNKVTNASAKYSSFAIGAECDKYDLKRIGKYSGTAGDSLQLHVGCKFSTKDQDNDRTSTKNCAEAYMGAWWYNGCHWRISY
ncbi:fibrinogen C domain-containing protein 1-like isoform X2 [Haematobia irritans]|uniref:fibrinogen C domain-containing protein 1-like isoform X2 n=1 Tax=Haematobia irritans TaxID=7368 RepID=UPI003F50A9E7